jgi:DeoR/GlpR family transcriptional regulator of sugar metabolism
MLKHERKREIINEMKSQGGFITVKELCARLYASESSIRRDLTQLEDSGVIKRTYGGAELNTGASNVTSFNTRAHHNVEAKKEIAKKGAALVRDGSVVFLDQSSTTFYLANEIMNKNSLTVVTNNIEILCLLSGSNHRVISSGGFLSMDNRSCLIGTDAQGVFENMYADIAFFSTKSLSDDGIISDCTREEVTLREAMLKNATKKVYLCDSEKIGTKSAYKQCALTDVDYLICENESAKKFNSLSDTLIIL